MWYNINTERRKPLRTSKSVEKVSKLKCKSKTKSAMPPNGSTTKLHRLLSASSDDDVLSSRSININKIRNIGCKQGRIISKASKRNNLFPIYNIHSVLKLERTLKEPECIRKKPQDVKINCDNSSSIYQSIGLTWVTLKSAWSPIEIM